MKISLFTNGIYPYVLGGMQKHSYNLAKYFAKCGVYVDLYHCVEHDKPIIEDLNCFSKEESKFITNFCFNFDKPFSFPGHYIVRSYNYSKKIYKAFLKKKDVDFVYAQGFTGWFYVLKKKNYNLPPIAVNFHGLEMYQKAASPKEWLKQQIFKPPLKKITKLTNINYSLGGKITPILKKLAPDQKVIERPNAVTDDWLVESFGEQKNKIKKFVFLGRYVRHKGIQELSKVLKSLTSIYNFEFNFIGPIPDKNKIVSKNILYHGVIEDKDGNSNKIKNILRNSDCLICPSYSEGMPTVILEAMASGCCIIASDVGAVRCIVDKNNGWLISPGNIDELCQSILEVINSDEKTLRQKKLNSLKKVKENFIWDKVIKNIINDITEFKKEY